MSKKSFLITSILLFLGLLAGAWLMLGGGDDAAAAAKNRELLVRPHSQALGRADAPVQLVEFLDPACGTCAKFYPLVKKIIADNREDIRLVIRYAPFHAGSDQVVKALEASRRQGKFWQALEALLVSQPHWVIQHRAQPDMIWGPLAGAGLDIERLKVDMQSPEVTQAVAQDVADGNALKVAATPEFFVNGRPLPSFGYDQLIKLVNEELAAARARKAG